LNELQENIKETFGIELTGAKKKNNNYALYRLPSNILLEFYVHLIDILEQLEKDCHIITVGNLNLNIQEDGCGHEDL
jgi:hypothetical protein